MTAPVAVGELIVRILVGALLGAVIGYERDVHGRPVGLRTHVLVAMASATFMVISAHFAFLQGYEAGGPVEVDGSRIAASVVSGIGFLAGGAILREGATIRGVTTAAGLWLVTAIGMSAGAGMFVIAVVVTVVGMLVLTVVRRLEDKNDAVHRLRVSVVGGPELDFDETLAKLEKAGATIDGLELDRRRDDKTRTVIGLLATVPRGLDATGIARVIEEDPAVQRVHVQRG